MTTNAVLDEIFQLKQRNPNYELEARITQDISSEQFRALARFLTEAGYERLDNQEVLDINFYTSNKKDNLSIRYSITGLDEIRNYCRLERAQVFQKLYKARLDWPETSKNVLEKAGAKLSRNGIYYGDNEYNFRINLKSEIETNTNGAFSDKIAKEEDNELNGLFERYGYDNVLKTFRYKKRTSFTTADKSFRIDLTLVKSNRKSNTTTGQLNYMPTKTFKEANCLNEKETYEVEIEYIGAPITEQSVAIVKSGFKQVIMTVISQLFSKTYKTISNTKATEILAEYIATVRQMIASAVKLQIQQVEQDLDSPYSLSKTVSNRSKEEIVASLKKTQDMVEKGTGYYKVDKGAPTQYFYGPKPVSMDVENIQANFPRNILNGYTVTDKADGETCILFVSRDGGIYLIDTNMNIYNVAENAKDTGIFSSILIGEYIGGEIPAFYCFDCYLVNLNDMRLLPLVAQPDQKSRIRSANETVDKLNGISNLPIKLSVKRFLWNPEQTIFSLTNAIWSARDTFPYRLDGVIYTPADTPVGFEPNRIDWLTQMGSRWTWNMKWKPPQENTIDFLVKVEKELIEVDCQKGIYIERDKIKYRTIMNSEKMEFIPYKTIHLYCGFRVNYSGNPCVKTSTFGQDMNKYLATIFTPTNPYNEKAYIAHIPCDETRGSNIFGKHDNQRVLDNTIVEFAYDLSQPATTDEDQAFRWVPLRTRTEKTEAYSKALMEKERLFKIYEKYRDSQFSRGYRWSPYETYELQDLAVLIVRFKLQPKGNLRDPAYIYGTITSKDNRHILADYLQSALDIPIKISYGNDFEVANAIWRSIFFPITDHMITTGENIPVLQDSEVLYYNRADIQTGRDKSVTRALQEFHNKYVKNRALYEVAVNALRLEDPNREIHLLDLACGKAGDLFKWNERKINRVVGVDINYNNIYDAKDGACMRYLEFKKRMEAYGTTDLPQVDFLYGDIGENIKNGSAMKAEHSVLQQKRLWEETYTARGFDLVSIQFAIHYLFENETKLNGLMKNIGQNLKPGGYLIGTCFDGATLYESLKGKKTGATIDGVKDGQTIWKIKKMYDNIGETMPADATSLGLGVEVYIQSINQSIREFLVNYDYLVKKLAEVHLEPVSTSLFGTIYDKFKGELNALSIDEQRLSFMNRLFIFRKKTGMGISIEETYQKIMAIHSNPEVNKALSRGIKQKKWSDLEQLLDKLGIQVDNFEEIKARLVKDFKEGQFEIEALRKKKPTAILAGLVKKAEEAPEAEPIQPIEKPAILEPEQLTGPICGIKSNPVGSACQLNVNENTEYCTYNANTKSCNKKTGMPTYKVIQEQIKQKLVVPAVEGPKVVVPEGPKVVVPAVEGPKVVVPEGPKVVHPTLDEKTQKLKDKWIKDFHTFSKLFGELERNSFDKTWLTKWLVALNMQTDKYKAEYNEPEKMEIYQKIIAMVKSRLERGK